MDGQLTQRLLRRARNVALWLRMDTLGDVHIKANTGFGGIILWRVSCGDDTSKSIGFYLYEDESFQVFGTYSSNVSPWTKSLGFSDPAGFDVLGHGSRATDWEDSLSQFDLFT